MSDERANRLSRRKLLAGVGGGVGVGGLVGGGATWAVLSDRETAPENRLTAGELDLKVAWQETYNGVPTDAYPPSDDDSAVQADVETREEIARRRFDAGLDGLTEAETEAVEQAFRAQFADLPDRLAATGRPPLVDLGDVKPGDSGSVVFDLHLFDNPGLLRVVGEVLSDAEGGMNEPEADAEDPNPGDAGELGSVVQARLWVPDDRPGGDGRRTLVAGTLAGVLGVLGPEFDLDADVTTPRVDCLPATTTQRLGFDWHVPEDAGDAIQTDSLQFTLGFVALQCRNLSLQESTELAFAEFPPDVFGCVDQCTDEESPLAKYTVIATPKGYAPGEIANLESFYDFVAIGNAVLNPNPVAPVPLGFELFKNIGEQRAVDMWLVMACGECVEDWCAEALRAFSEKVWEITEVDPIHLTTVNPVPGAVEDGVQTYKIRKADILEVRRRANRQLFEEFGDGRKGLDKFAGFKEDCEG